MLRILHLGFREGMFMILFMTVPIVWLCTLSRFVEIMAKVREGAAWSETEGTVTESRLEKSYREVTRRRPTRRGDGPEAPYTTQEAVYTLHFRYSYKVNGAEYECSSVRFGFVLRPPGIVKRYPEGAPVTVYYDPANPERAVLERGMGITTWAIMAAAAAYSLFMLFAPVVFVASRVLGWMIRRKLAPRVNEVLRRGGFKFVSWDKSGYSFGDKRRTKVDDSAFSLVEPPFGGYSSRRGYQEGWPPLGIAVREKNNRLVEIFNSGQRDRRGMSLLRIVIETPWTRWIGAEGRDSKNRKLSIWRYDKGKAFELRFLYLAMRSDDTGIGKADWICSRIVSDFSSGDEEQPGLDPFDTGDETFDGFFRIRRGGRYVAEALAGGAPGEALLPLSRWKGLIFDIVVTDMIDVWIDLRKIPRWDVFAGQINEIADDLEVFAGRLENCLIRPAGKPKN